MPQITDMVANRTQPRRLIGVLSVGERAA